MTAFHIRVGVTAHTGLGHLLGRGLQAVPPRGRAPYTGSLQIVSLTSGFFQRFKLRYPMYLLLFGPLRKTELLLHTGFVHVVIYKTVQFRQTLQIPDDAGELGWW